MNVARIRRHIEDHTEQALRFNPFADRARQGKLSRNEVATYLHNLRYILSQTPAHLEEAARLSRERGITLLAKYMEDKIPEEAGHDQWATNDLEHHLPNVSIQPKVLPATERVMSSVRAKLAEHPINYLYYMTFVEYFTVLGGPTLLRHLQEKCGIEPAQMSVVLNHTIADQDHIEEDFVILEQLGSLDEQQGCELIDHYAGLISDFLAACVTQRN